MIKWLVQYFIASKYKKNLTAHLKGWNLIISDYQMKGDEYGPGIGESLQR